MEKSYTQTVTPDCARRMLARGGPKNRPLREARVRQIAADMKAGKFVLNGESIVLADDWSVLDGQHRLTACVRSGVTFRSVIVTGIPADTFATIDSGAGRTRKDVLAVAGEINRGTLAAGAKLVYLAETGQLSRVTEGEIQLGFTPDAMLDVLARHPGLRDAASAACRYNSQFKPCTRTTWTFLVYWLCRDAGEAGRRFLDGLATGDLLEPDSPIRALRNRLIDNAASRAKLRLTDTLAVCIKAWQAHRCGKPMRQVRWGKGEPFPDVDQRK